MLARCASDEITLRHGPHAVTLRPSLRAATRLERLHEGFPGLMSKIAEFDTRTIDLAIRASATDPRHADELLRHAAQEPLKPFTEAAQRALIDLLALLITPADDVNDRPAKAAAQPMSWAECYRQLYRIATGWLGWSPAAAWAATPQEIEEAFAGHIEKLKAIHGAAEEETTPTPAKGTTDAEIEKMIAAGGDPTFQRAKLHRLKGKGSAHR